MNGADFSVMRWPFIEDDLARREAFFDKPRLEIQSISSLVDLDGPGAPLLARASNEGISLAGEQRAPSRASAEARWRSWEVGDGGREAEASKAGDVHGGGWVGLGFVGARGGGEKELGRYFCFDFLFFLKLRWREGLLAMERRDWKRLDHVSRA